MDTQKEDHLKTQGEGGHLQAKERAHDKPTPATPLSQTSSLQIVRK